MQEIKIQDDSGDKDFFTIIPNYIANHSTANDQALYFQMKKHAGEAGQCFATSETLMKKLGIGRKAFNKSLEYLLEKKWISFIGLTQGKTRPIKTYKVNNIWKMNTEHYKKISPKRTLSIKDKKISVKREQDTSQKNTKIAPERTVEEEPFKEEPRRRISSSKKPYYQGEEMRYSKGRWWVLPSDGSSWLEFALTEKEIEWR